MGTRNLTMVIDQEGETKIAQYGQWDGYPEGQGSIALEFLKSCDMEKFKKQIKGLKFLTDKEIEKINNDPNWIENYPYLSRDAGAKILSYVYNQDKNRKITGLTDQSEFAADSLFCEWAYVIDFKKGTFEVYKGFNKTPLKKTERFAHLKGGDGYQPVTCIKKYKLNNLPTEENFLKEMNKIIEKIEK